MASIKANFSEKTITKIQQQSTDHDIQPLVCEVVSSKYSAIRSNQAKNRNKQNRNDIDPRKETITFR